MGYASRRFPLRLGGSHRCGTGGDRSAARRTRGSAAGGERGEASASGDQEAAAGVLMVQWVVHVVDLLAGR